MKQVTNILVVLLIMAIGFMTLQYVPVFKKSGIKMEMTKKIPISTEEEEEEKEDEKENDPEKKETNSSLYCHGNFRFKYNQCCKGHQHPLIISYLDAILKNSTPPPEKA